MPRIVLVHPYRPSMAPIEDAFTRLWPDAEVLALLDESLYADAAPDGTLKPLVPARIGGLFEHAVASGADAIVFTGSTFGPAVEAARQGIAVPVLKSDEAVAELAAGRGERILLVCTAARAVPVIKANLLAALQSKRRAGQVTDLTVAPAKDALVAGDEDQHDALIRDAILGVPDIEAFDAIVLGQVSMGRVVGLLPQALAGRVLTTAESTVEYLRARFGG